MTQAGPASGSSAGAPGPGAEPARGPDRFRRLDRDAFDVAVIGAGLGGLTAAALCARRGLRVLVVDRHYRVGGSATLFRRRGYRFDVGVHYVGGAGPGGALNRILAAAGAEGVAFEELDPGGIDTLHFPDFTFRVPRGARRFRSRLLARFPLERAGIDRYFTALDELRAVHHLLVASPASSAVLARAPLLASYLQRPFADFLQSCTGDLRLRAVLAAQSGDYALPPSRASTFAALGMTHHYLDGAWMPRGGGQAISDAVAAAVEAAGGRFLLRATAERIVVERGRATAVVVHSAHLGRRTLRASAVISNADIKHTLLDLLEGDAVRPATRARAEAWEATPGLGVLFLGLRLDDVAWGRTNHFIFPDYDLERPYRDAAAAHLPEDPMAFVSNATAKDPHNRLLSPPGVSNVEVISLAPAAPAAWGVSAAAAQDGSYHRSPAYRAAKERFCGALLAAVRPLLPDVRARVVFAELATPLTHHRFTGARFGPYGIAQTPAQTLSSRPGARTEIDGLYLCGASCRAGHGVLGAMASGVLAAQEVVGGSLLQEVFRRRAGAGEHPAHGEPG